MAPWIVYSPVPFLFLLFCLWHFQQTQSSARGILWFKVKIRTRPHQQIHNLQCLSAAVRAATYTCHTVNTAPARGVSQSHVSKKTQSQIHAIVYTCWLIILLIHVISLCLVMVVVVSATVSHTPFSVLERRLVSDRRKNVGFLVIITSLATAVTDICHKNNNRKCSWQKD